MIEGSHPTRQKETIRDNVVIPNDYDNEKFGDTQKIIPLMMTIIMTIKKLKIFIIGIIYSTRNSNYTFNKYEFN
jgi:hypothetical protein